jgi:serine/threonine protein kinase/Tfp pilus assembly protein PilF
LKFLEKFGMKAPASPLGGRYRVIDKLGAGGFGQTFLAQDVHLPGHPVCVIKQLHPQTQDTESLKTARRLFNTEAEVLYRLGNHPQIPRLLAHFEDRQEFYLAQEYVAGRSLSEVLADGQPWPQERVIALLQDILQVLAVVHQQQVIHRDIKPSNLLCRDRDRHIVLIDFGAVKQVNTRFLTPSSTSTNLTVSIGTQGYMPNEQLAGSPRFSSDVYAVGMVGIQALTGIHPQDLKQDPRTLEFQWRDSRLPVHPDLADWLDRMVRYDVRARYPTAGEALAALQALPDALLAHGPDHWYTPLTIASSPSLADTPTSTLVAARAEPTESMALPPPSGNSPPTQVVMGRYTGPTLGTDKPQGSTVAIASMVSSLTQAFPPQNRLLLGLLLMLGSGLLVFRACVSSPPATTMTETAPPATAAPDARDPARLAEAQVEQAEHQRQAGHYQPALDHYDQAIAHAPDLAIAHWGRCYSLNQLQQFEAAIAACDQAIALDSQDPRPLSSKGFALQQQQQYADALALFDQALDLQPDDPEVWNNRGTVLLQLQEPEAALEAFDRATELQPDLAAAWSNRGAALWSLRQFDAAADSVDRAIELQPDYADAISLREQMRIKLGR